MKFILEIELGNDAMQTTGHIATALHKVARKMNDIDSYQPVEEHDDGGIMDENGNSVGTWRIANM